MNFFQKNRLSPLLGVMFFITVCVFASCQKSDTPIVMKDDASMSGVEALKNATGGTQSADSSWTANPFQTGNMVSTGSALKFRKPNTEWKSRTIQLKDGRWLSYEFGKGNPVGSTLLSEIEKKSYRDCYHDPNLSIISCGNLGEEVYGYVSPDIEQSLMDLLKNPSWEKVLLNCEQDFRKYQFDWTVNYDSVLHENILDIEKFLLIDDVTGRKTLQGGVFSPLRSWFTNAIRERKEVSGKSVFDLDNCITRNGGMELYRLMDVIYQKQFYPE